MKVALWSAAPALGDVDANIRTVADAMDTDDDLVVFPELFLTGYNIGDDVQRLAFQDGDDRLALLAGAAKKHGTHLVVGAPYTPRKGLTYNAALCITDAGEATWIPKRALPTFTTFREGLFFAHGEAQPVWETRLGTFGIGICYDLYFPEFHKRQALDGADVLLNISASPSVSRRFFETLLPARAVENACFMLYSNNVGSQDGVVFWGGSQAYGPRGDRLARHEEYEDGPLHVECSLDDLVAAREFRPTIRDSDVTDLDDLERDPAA